jgi:hypothetical protein
LHDQRRKLLDKKAKVRLKTRKGWRHNVNEYPDVLQYDVEELKAPLAPWRTTNLYFDEVKLGKNKDQYTTEELKMLTEEKIGEINSEVVIYTDGSTSSDQENGGAGVFIDNRRAGTEIHEKFPAGAWCSSYAAESVALLRSLQWLEVNPAETTTICTDSMSLHEALSNGDWKDAQDWIKEIKQLSH